MSTRRFGLFGMGLLAGFVMSGAAFAQPVMVGGEPSLDACGSTGVVAGLNPAGDGFLAVRSGPGTGHSIQDKIRNGQGVIFCDQRGSWVGIVYSKKGTSCGVSSPIARRQPYRGPCRSGWVHEKYLKLLAG